MTPGDRPDPPLPSRRALREDRSLLHEEGACLPLRSRHGQCRKCADACPARALTVSLAGVSLSEACTGCGRCSAACPTEALTLPEMLALPAPGPGDELPAASAPLRIECRMVPAEWLEPGSLVVPCTGACSPGRLMAQAAAGRAVVLVDRGWCAGCPAAGASSPDVAATDVPQTAAAAHPAAAAIATAVAWLEAVGDTTAIGLRAEPLPVRLRPTALRPPPEQPAPLDRRRFFRAALEKPAGREVKPTPMGGDGRATYPADQRQPSPERSRQHLALQLLAARHAQDVPAEFYPSLHADGRCCDRRLCVALCPTAALGVADDGGTAHLRFDPVRCIGCGTCERACPESALLLTPHGGTPATATLVTHTRLRCAECGDAYTGTEVDVDTGKDDATGTADQAPVPATRRRCPTCTKSHRFMSDARRQLFGALN